MSRRYIDFAPKRRRAARVPTAPVEYPKTVERQHGTPAGAAGAATGRSGAAAAGYSDTAAAADDRKVAAEGRLGTATAVDGEVPVRVVPKKRSSTDVTEPRISVESERTVTVISAAEEGEMERGPAAAAEVPVRGDDAGTVAVKIGGANAPRNNVSRNGVLRSSVQGSNVSRNSTLRNSVSGNGVPRNGASGINSARITVGGGRRQGMADMSVPTGMRTKTTNTTARPAETANATAKARAARGARSTVPIGAVNSTRAAAMAAVGPVRSANTVVMPQKSHAAGKSSKPNRSQASRSATPEVSKELKAPDVPMELAQSGGLLDDPMERPISEFADLEVLAQEIEEVTRGGVVEEETQFVAAEESFSLRQQPQFGVIEDYQPKFVNTTVEKRPLSKATGAAEAQIVPSWEAMASVAVEEQVVPSKRTAEMKPKGKAAGKTARTGVNTGINSAVARRATQQTPPSQTPSLQPLQPPKAQFINQNKVPKRPLSGAEYAGGIRTTGAKTGAPEAASSPAGANAKVKTDARLVDEEVKPEKKKKGGSLGMVLAIVGTIILGAVVGTVAFLIMPR